MFLTNITMIKKALFTLALCLQASLYGQTDKVAEAQHTILGQKAAGYAHGQNVRSNTAPGAQWFPDAGLGLFIHFGLAAEHGGIDLSWGMYANKNWEDGELAPSEYWQIAETWNPDQFDAASMAKQAKEAGFKYMVFTTKHHDGYTMWPSEYGEIGVKKFLGGRDLVAEFVEACRDNDLKVGLYFSPPDWYFDREYINWDYSGQSIFGLSHESLDKLPIASKAHEKNKTELTRGQLTELLTKYGTIDLLWFDGGKAEMSNDEVRKLQPNIIINRRNGEAGDYADSEGVIPSTRFDTWFEACDPCWPERWWSYSYSDRMASANSVIEKLILMRTWGGNYLANVGPKGNGEIPEEALEAWKEMATWMNHSGESIFEVSAGDFPEKSNQPITWKGDDIAYVHAYPNFHKEIEIQNDKEPKQITLLRTGDQLQYKMENGLLKVNIPPKLRSRMVDTIKIVW